MNNLTERERIAYEKLRKDFNLPTTQAQLRQDILIANNKTTYNFNFLRENQDALPEVKLNRTDIFLATRIGLYMYQITLGEEARSVLQTYPNPTHFADNASPEDLEIFYNGVITSQVNNTILYEKFPTRKFRSVPQTQESATLVHSQQNWQDGMIPIEPRMILNGNQKNEFNVNVPIFSGAAVAAATVATIGNYLVMVMEGFLVSGGSDKHSQMISRPASGRF